MQASIFFACLMLAAASYGCKRSSPPASTLTKFQDVRIDPEAKDQSKQPTILITLYDPSDSMRVPGYALVSYPSANESDLDGFWRRASYAPISNEQLSLFRKNAGVEKTEVLQEFGVLRKIGRFELLVARHIKASALGMTAEAQMQSAAERFADERGRQAPNADTPDELLEFDYVRLPGQKAGTAGILLPITLASTWDGREPIFVRSFQQVEELIDQYHLKVMPLETGGVIPQGIGDGFELWPAHLADQFNAWLRNR